MNPPRLTYSRRFFRSAPRELWCSVPVDKEDRGPEQVGDRRRSGVDHLPLEQALPVAASDVDDVADVVGVVVPVVQRGMAQLSDQDRRPALRQKQERKAGRQNIVLLLELAFPGPAELVSIFDKFLGAQAIPVMIVKEPYAREPAGSLQAVEVVEPPLLAGTEVLADREVTGQPVDSGLDVAVDSTFATVLDRLANENLAALDLTVPRDDQARNPWHVMLAVGVRESGV